MKRGWAVIDDGPVVPLSEARIPVLDPGLTLGWTVFETLIAEEGVTEGFDEHMERLAHSCEAACIPMPSPAALGRGVAAVSARVGGKARVRITLTGGGRRIVTATAAEEGRRHRPVRAARGIHRDEPYLGGAVKHGSRAPWAVAVARSGADEVLLVDAAGRFTEGTSCGILAVLDGVLWTAPYDGRILPSTTVLELLRLAGDLGIPVRREGPPAAGPWDALYVASVTRNIAPVVRLDDQELPTWDEVGIALRDARKEGP